MAAQPARAAEVAAEVAETRRRLAAVRAEREVRVAKPGAEAVPVPGEAYRQAAACVPAAASSQTAAQAPAAAAVALPVDPPAVKPAAVADDVREQQIQWAQSCAQVAEEYLSDLASMTPQQLRVS